MIVIRHPQVGSVQLAASSSPVPVINAGDGTGEHPTQALLDIFTIREELGTVNGLTITLVGDLKNGRTIHSLVKLLSLYDVKLNFVSHATLAMPATIIAELTKLKVKFTEQSNLEAVMSSSDVIYATSINKEMF